MSEFEPQIVAFFCNWCTFTAADLAGTSGLSYSPSIKIIRVMCSGMVDPKYVIKAFLEGADGVLVSGCNPGDCHYINGNYKARRRIKLLKQRHLLKIHRHPKKGLKKKRPPINLPKRAMTLKNRRPLKMLLPCQGLQELLSKTAHIQS